MILSRRHILQGCAVLGASGLLQGCGSSYDWNQKLTVVVQTPGGEKSGSAVTGVNTKYGRVFGTGTEWEISMRGEATVVDLGQGKYLFALLNERTKTLASVVFANKTKGVTEANPALSIIRDLRETAPVPREHYPMLVTFGDIKEPKSVKEVKPENLAAAFGGGYALKSITLEITDEQVTEGVAEKLLPWALTVVGRIKPIGNPIPSGYKPEPIEEIYRDAFVRKTPS